MGSLAKLQTVRSPARAMATSSRTQPSMWIDANSGYALPLSAYSMTPEVALTLSHVYCAVDISSSDFGTMTCQLFRDDGDGKTKVKSSTSGIGKVAYQLRWQPNGWQTAKAFWSTMAWQYQLRPKACAEIVYEPGSDAYISALIPRHPDRVYEERLPSGRIRFKLTGEPGGKPRYLTQDEMFIVRNTSTDGLNAVSRVQFGSEALASGKALQQFTRNYFEHGATAALLATYKGGTMEPLEEEQYHARIARFMNGTENAGGIFLTPEDLDVKALGVDPEKRSCSD
jgi:HK97 family phage portal protein